MDKAKFGLKRVTRRRGGEMIRDQCKSKYVRENRNQRSADKYLAGKTSSKLRECTIKKGRG